MFSENSIDKGYSLRLVTLSVFLTLWNVPLIVKKNIQISYPLKEPAILIYLLFIFFGIISSLYSINKKLAYTEIIEQIIYLFFLISCANQFKKKSNINTLCKLLTLINSSIIIYAIYEINELPSSFSFVIKETYAINSVFIHRNIFSLALILLIPFQVYLLSLNKRSFWSHLITINLSINIFFIVALQSRAAWIYLFILSSIYIYYINRNKLSINTKDIKITTSIISIIIIITFSYFQTYQSITDRLISSNSHSEVSDIKDDSSISSIEERLHLWDNSINIITDNLFFGIGPAN